jgi:formylglycine-generating enzyme required for sulfatase activity
MFKLSPLDMISVPGGTFPMGDPFGDGFINEKPVHQVTLSDFSISKFEITQKAWIQTMGSNPAKFWGEENPVESVSWNDAVNYCNTRSTLEGLQQCYKTVNGVVTCDFSASGYRLPTEAEWEYAARGGAAGSNFKYSGGSDLKEVGWFYTYSENVTHQAGTKKPNQLGIYDMSGNVWEYCFDYFDANYYFASPLLNPAGPAQGQSRVARGGSWTDDSVFNRIFYRNFYSQNARGSNVGFRVVRGVR